MAELRKLPIGIENFEKICQEDFYYGLNARVIATRVYHAKYKVF